MSESQRWTIAVCGPESEALRGAAGLLRGQDGWEPQLVRWPENEPPLDPSSTRAYLLVAADQPCAELEAKLSKRPADVPLIAIGRAVGAEVAAACWFPTLPAASLLTSVLRQLIPKEASPTDRTWRRKSDMIIGSSPAIRDILNQLDRLAPSSGSVLITGESGTGKELVARALHYSGPRSPKPFLAVNCAAIPETLFESELFGYTRGAFTGAVTSRAGIFEAADGGTVFLDEIGELPMSMQAKLLRVLETSEVTRLGSTEAKRVDIRLVSATNRPMEQAVKQGKFREDLYYRIRVFPIQLPPLRERPEDLPQLISHHVGMISEKDHHPPPSLTAAALEKLLSHRWPGNVRELVNVLQRAVLSAEHGEIDDTDIALPNEEEPSLIVPYHQAKGRFERQYYVQLLRASGGNVSMAAKLADKTRKEIYDALRRLELDAAQFRSTPK